MSEENPGSSHEFMRHSNILATGNRSGRINLWDAGTWIHSLTGMDANNRIRCNRKPGRLMDRQLHRVQMMGL